MFSSNSKYDSKDINYVSKIISPITFICLTLEKTLSFRMQKNTQNRLDESSCLSRRYNKNALTHFHNAPNNLFRVI